MTRNYMLINSVLSDILCVWINEICQNHFDVIIYLTSSDGIEQPASLFLVLYSILNPQRSASGTESVSEMKLFVRLTLCVFSNYNIMSSSPISYSLLMST